MSKALRRIPKVLKKKWNRPDKNLKYLNVSFDIARPYYNNQVEDEDDDEDGDARSISTVSTNATMDNNPGTGRIIDKCIYQYLGRKIERFANRVSISLLSPAEILRSVRLVGVSTGITIDPHTLEWIIDRISVHPLIPLEPGAFFAGLKSLIRQSQSNSLYRSAAALAALISLSTSWDLYTWFYEIIAAIEPIFRLQTLALALSDSHPEKKYYLSLTSLARAQLHYRVYRDEIPESLIAFNLQIRQSLLNILESQQSSEYDPLEIITNACGPFAKCFAYISRYFSGFGLIPDVEEIVETAYLLIITFTRCFIVLYHQTTDLDASTLQLRCLILSTYVRWVDDLTFCYLHHQYGDIKGDLKFVQQICKLRGPLLLFGSVMPGILSSLHDKPVMFYIVFPRRIREPSCYFTEPPILRNYVKMYTDVSVKRAGRLMTSFDDLKQELRCSAAYASPSGLPHPVAPREDYYSLMDSLDRARQVQVSENDLTDEFIFCRDPKHYYDSQWRHYKRNVRARRLWGAEMCSNLDWDWDPSSSLKRLFKIEKKPLESTSRVTPNSLGLSVSAFANGPQITVFIESAHADVLEKVDVRIMKKSEDKKTKDTAFTACSLITREGDTVVEEGGYQSTEKGFMAVQTDYGTEIILEDTSTAAGDDSKGVTCLHSTPPHHETKAWHDQMGFGGSSSDLISICSLD